MTANNPLARWLSRWFMRFEAAGSVLRIVYFGGILVTTGVSALKQFGHGQWAWPFVGTVTAGTIIFSYVYAERGLFNQKNRDSADVGQNFAGPEMLMDDILIGTAMFAAREGRAPTPEEREAIAEAVAGQWADYRDGVDVEDLSANTCPTSPEAQHTTPKADGGTVVAPNCAACEETGVPDRHKDQDVIVCPNCENILFREMEIDQ